jgi:hypothetical protein
VVQDETIETYKVTHSPDTWPQTGSQRCPRHTHVDLNVTSGEAELVPTLQHSTTEAEVGYWCFVHGDNEVPAFRDQRLLCNLIIMHVISWRSDAPEGHTTQYLQ